MKKVFISMACVLIALSGCTNGGSNKESMEVVLNIKRKVKPECVSALKESFLKCKESTLLEPVLFLGCITDLRRNHPSESQTEGNGRRQHASPPGKPERTEGT